MNCYFITFGCKVNTCDTACMQELLQKENHTIVSHQDQADIFILNSCTVTESGDNRVRTAIRKLRQSHPEAKIVLTGCYVQAYPEQACAISEADLVLGTKGRNHLPRLLTDLEHGCAEKNAVCTYDGTDPFEQLPCTEMHENTRAFLKIQDGCNCFCSYCIIPYARGRCRSLPMDAVQSAAQAFAENGYRELVLCGINLGYYGMEPRGSTPIRVQNTRW